MFHVHICLHRQGVSCSYLPPQTACFMFIFASTDSMFHVHICLHRQHVSCSYLPPQTRCFMFMFASTDSMFHVHICLHRQGVSCSCLPPQTAWFMFIFASTEKVFHVHVCLHRQGVSCSCLPPQTEVLGADSSVVNAALPLPSRNVTKRVDMLRPLYDHIITRTYRFPTNSGEELSTYEYLGESKLTFLLPVQLL